MIGMVIVTLDDGRQRGTILAKECGYRQEDGKFRVLFKDGTSGIVTQNPAPEGTLETIFIKPLVESE